MKTISNYTNATQLLEEGKTKDAYAAFLSVVELSTQQLHGVKFVHQTPVSKPIEFEDSIALLKLSIDHLYKIATISNDVQRKLPGAFSPTITSATIVTNSHQSSSNNPVKPPPPVPPKPYHISKQPQRPPPTTSTTILKPDPPPKPASSSAKNKVNVPTFSKLKSDIQKKRSRGNSVSFAEDTKLCKSRTIEQHNETQLDDNGTVPEQQYEICGKENKDITAAEWNQTSHEPSHSSSRYQPPLQIRPVVSRSSSSLYSSPSSAKNIPCNLQNRSKSWIVPSSCRRSTSSSNSNSNGSHDSLLEEDDAGVDDGPIDVLLESIVNPRNLMPAQTSTGDSLTLPTLSLETDKNNNSSDNYVPNIPAPPLLATHKRIQQRINDLETESQYSSNSLHKVKCARQTLEKVRSLYMSAMTIPSIMHFPPHLIAYQLTLIESSIFCAIPREALLTHSSRTPHKKIVASTDFFNYTTRFIEHSILLPQEAYRRAEIIHRWIKIATKLYLLHNYQTLKAVVSALGTPPIKRLRRTWDCIPKKKMAKLEMLSHLMSETDNYQKYREHIQVEQNTCNNRLSSSSLSAATTPTTSARAFTTYCTSASSTGSWTKPIVPFLGVFIHDVTYLYAAVKKENEDPQQNRRVLEVLHQIQMFQKAPKYPPYPIIDENNHSVTLPRGRKKKNLFRPIDALHFVGGNSSRKDHNNNGSTIFGAATAALMLGDEERMEPQQEVEVEQQLITQYLLMRPWVNEKTIDALSNLREPMNKPRSSSSPTTVTTAAAAVNASGRYNSSSMTNSGDYLSSSSVRSNNHGNHASRSDSTPSAPLLRKSSAAANASSRQQMTISTAMPSSSSSIFSSASSLIRFSGNDHSDPSVVTSVDESTTLDDNSTISNTKRSFVGGFWPFRKSNDMSRQLYVEPASGSGRDFAITNSWSEVDDDDDDDDEDSEDKEYKDTLDEPMTTPSISRNDNSGSLNMRLRFPSVASSNNRNSSNIHTKGHSRSFSLPA